MKSTEMIEIEASVDIIRAADFYSWKSLDRVMFSSSNHLKKIDVFRGCASLCRIEIPSSVEVIRWHGFLECTSLNEICFSSDSELREINGLQRCTSLCRIGIPSSVEKIGDYGFNDCASLTNIVFSSDSHLRSLSLPFVRHPARMMTSRSALHLWKLGKPMTSTDEGISIRQSDVHLRNP
jgi:hypothetical protein